MAAGGRLVSVRIALVGCLIALAGCGREPERSRVVPSAEVGRKSGEATPRVAPGDVHKIEMH